MGISGFIFKKRDYIDTEKTINDIKEIASKLKVNFYLRMKKYNENNNFIYAETSIYDDVSEEGFIFYVSSLYDTIDICGEHEFDWIDTNLADFLVIESFNKREKLLLDFLYEYFKMGNEKDYFWCECKWYFDFEAIKKLKEEPFYEDWPYFPPK